MFCSNHCSSEQESSTLIEAHNVCRDFATEASRIRALSPISLEIATGDFIVIRGPSGSGKSTLLSLLAGLDRPTGGKVFFRGIALHDAGQSALARLRNRHFGFIFQSPHMLYDRTVIENVALPATYNAQILQTAAKTRALDLLDYVGLSGLAQRRPQTLSGGELQRVAFARALLCHPEIIFADEPTGSLDADNSRLILNLLKGQCKQQRTVIMVTHDDQAMTYGSRIIHLDKFAAQGRSPTDAC